MKTKRRNIAVTPHLETAIKAYQVDNGLPSWNEALLRLAATQLGIAITPDTLPQWGGKRDRHA